MNNILLLWPISFVFMVLFDAAWFYLTIESFYKPYLKNIISGNFNYLVGAIFYLLYSLGLSYLIVFQGLKANQPGLTVLFNGFVLGFMAYAAYDLTNLATIKDWPIIVTVIDILWGGFISAAVSGITYKIASML